MDNIQITKRFILAIKSLEINGLVKSQSSIAESLGIHRQSLNEMMKEKRGVTLNLLQKFSEVYFINPSFLLLGHTPMFYNPEESKNKNNISYVPLKVQAGYAEQIENPVFEEELEKFTIPGQAFKEGEYRCFEVEGDSMHPNYQKGDNVICSHLPNTYFAQALKEKQAYVIITKNALLLKRIINNVKESKSIILISDNEFFEPKTISIFDVVEIWKVEGLITKRNFSINRVSDL